MIVQCYIFSPRGPFIRRVLQCRDLNPFSTDRCVECPCRAGGRAFGYRAVFLLLFDAEAVGF